MTFCGYNATMAKGLRTFAEGMVLAMEERHAKGIPMAEVVRTELVDLAAMNAVLGQGETSFQLDALVSINLFAQAAFSAAATCADSAPTFRGACLDFVDEFVGLVKETEERHQSELAARSAQSGDVASIEAVAHWLQTPRADPSDLRAAE